MLLTESGGHRAGSGALAGPDHSFGPWRHSPVPAFLLLPSSHSPEVAMGPLSLTPAFLRSLEAQRG